MTDKNNLVEISILRGTSRMTDKNNPGGISLLRDTRVLTSDGVFPDAEGKQDLISFVRRKSI